MSRFFVAFFVAVISASSLHSVAYAAGTGEASKPAAPFPASPSSAGLPAAALPAEIQIGGFRSAKFGMTESETRSAIERDFNIPAASVKMARNPSERTQVLTIKVNDLMPDSGTAEVSYVLGYKSSKLFQIVVLWSKTTDDTLTPERITSNAEGLSTYFASEPFASANVVSNFRISDGVVLFRGKDSTGRVAMVVLKGKIESQKSVTQEFIPSAAVIYYVLNPEEPDIFRIPAGKF